MKVYLGGKMSGRQRGDNWRNDIVNCLSHDGDYGSEFGGGYGIDLSAGCGEGAPPETWPVLPGAILGKHDYVGPYLVSCDHGCFHSGDHATSIEWGPESFDGDVQKRKAFRDSNRQQIAKLCTEAMLDADVLFFWIDSLDAYGTLAELIFFSTFVGLTNAINKHHGEALVEKHIFIASPSFAAIDEMWLAFQLVKVGTALSAPTPKEALEMALASIEEPSDYSPIEKMFIEKWRTMYGNGISPQFSVPGFRYRVDFAFPDDKVAVELDGYEYHNNKDQFTNDRKRQREMEAAGWRFIRFSGSEVYNNTEACVRQAYEFWKSIQGVKG